MEEIVASLLRAASLPPAVDVKPLQGGRNNKVFRVTTSSEDFLLKCYFHHPEDPRDRLGQEFGFLKHLSRTECQFSARPLASDRANHVGLMEFIEGVRPQVAEVDEKHIDQAIRFFFEANRELDHPATLQLPPASEACFTIAEHIARTQTRVERLSQILLEDEVDAAAADFVRRELVPTWTRVRRIVETEWRSEEARNATLSQGERCLSPSDFGFHNSLRQNGCRLKFFDFEYAGWDDPAKLIVDFANQPDMTLDRILSDRFRAAVVHANADAHSLTRRVAALEPLYQVKWACICLNDFLSFGRSRHQFSGEQTDHRTRREFQLTRAREMLARAG
jgi:Phosphotransferase enzyme family